MKPSINEVLSKIDNRYYLVGTVAKRAREIVDGNEPYIETKINKGKPVMLATEEISEGKITYRLLTEEEIEIQEALHAEEQSKLIEE
ncbi:DNA-directed RNA polymerase subunit omega [Terrisporobacter mayombei]|uniref:DNA-directed RNA polymerase subunit omega n=2 Tax=root TaxID=1 RepID=A0ABY9Q314_9FIRM|nr:DNA-directed RNA polymerase subunit omega [Terrisporobacter mayombei]MCC3867319.1 DNA-directed RNA polymerase subunit omega [Terrisporobacter mayombei]WMT81581.1 DNA-directed RNA polymerase subunit omega [Terrisporobacter mayombei]